MLSSKKLTLLSPIPLTSCYPVILDKDSANKAYKYGHGEREGRLRGGGMLKLCSGMKMFVTCKAS